jgi:hypothetical protein
MWLPLTQAVPVDPFAAEEASLIDDIARNISDSVGGGDDESVPVSPAASGSGSPVKKKKADDEFTYRFVSHVPSHPYTVLLTPHSYSPGLTGWEAACV